MELISLNIAPGVNTEKSPKDAAPQWQSSNRIRFNNGYLESIGGWIKDNENTFNGVARGITSWVTLRNEVFIGLGTHKRLLLWQGGTYLDITPVRETGTLGSNPFSTSAGTTTVTVDDTGHGALVGDGITFSGASVSPTDSTDVNGTWEVASVIDADTYTFELDAAVTTTEANFGGASAAYTYQINVGQESNTPAYGFGAGAWGDSTFDTPRTTPVGFIDARTWQLDQWGEDLIANVKGGAIYVWDSSVGTGTPAAVISGAPSSARWVLVSPQGRHLVAFGVPDASAVDDPLLIQWSTSDDYTDFDISSLINSAGELRIQVGTEIVGAIRTRGQILVLTDISAHSMFSTGDSSVFGIETLGEGCGLIAPNAITEHSGVAYWMGLSNVYIYDGVVRPLPCDIWSYVYGDINLQQKTKFHASTLVDFDEIWFFYCSSDSSEIDRYFKYNTAQQVWDYGNLDRTVYIDYNKGAGIDKPYAADASGVLYQHEEGITADGSALEWSAKTHDITIQDGKELYHVSKLHPDFQNITGSVDVKLYPKKYPQSTAVEKGPYNITTMDKRKSVRARGRQMAIEFAGNSVSDSATLGTFQGQIQLDGGR